MMNEGVKRLILAAGILSVPGVAMAQEVGEAGAITIAADLNRSDVAGARTEPGFDPVPILIGPVFIEPSLSIVGGYDSNVFNRSPGQDAAVLSLTPVLRVRTNAPRHEARFAAVGHVRRFSSFESENSEEFDLRADGRLDVIDRHSISTSAGFARLIEPRSSAGSVANAAEPVSYDRLSGGVGADLELGPWRISSDLGVTELDYAPVELTGGGSLDQSFRDTRAVSGDVAIRYEFSGLVSAFATASYADVDSLAAPAALIRDSRNVSIMAGLRGEISSVMSGEVGVGYRRRDYALPRYLDFSGLTYRADVQWYLTPLVTLRLQARQDFQNSGNPQVAGILSNRIIASAYYDPLRNLRLFGAVAYEHNRYRETDTRTHRPSLRLQAQYRFNPHFAFGAFASLLHQDVSGTPIVQSFTSFTAGLGITLNP